MSYEESDLMNGTDLPGFHSLLGYSQASWEENEAVIELELQARHLNLGGVIHGGVLTSLLDIAMAQAGTHCPYPGRMRKAITLSLTTTFTGQCSSGVIRVTGRKRVPGSLTAPGKSTMTRATCWPLPRALSAFVPAATSRKVCRFDDGTRTTSR